MTKERITKMACALFLSIATYGTVEARLISLENNQENLINNSKTTLNQEEIIKTTNQILNDSVDGFDCDNSMYISNGTSLYRYGPSGNQRFLFEVGNINALAFSNTGLMWAYDQDTEEVVTFDKTGQRTVIDVPNLPTRNIDYNVGVTDTNGYFYLYDGQAAARFYIIDTDPNRATYGQLVDPTANGGKLPYELDKRNVKGTVIKPTANGGENRRIFGDWCYNPTDGRLYTMIGTHDNIPDRQQARIVSYDPITGGMQTHGGKITGGGIQSANTTFGAIFINMTGEIYVFGNQIGHLFMVDTVTNTATKISTTPITSSNVDGANCLFNDQSLPIKMVSFEIELLENQAHLNWVTTSEKDNKGFEVERSNDGKEWTKIGFVSSQSVISTGLKNNYSFVDDNPIEGHNYYRLKQIDFDGSFEYSVIRSLIIGGEKEYVLYPNPVQNELTVSGIKGDEIIEIYDINGKMLNQYKVNKLTKSIDVAYLNAGIYYVRIMDTQGNITSHKIIKK